MRASVVLAAGQGRASLGPQLKTTLYGRERNRMSTARKSWTVFQVLTVLILTIGTAGWVVPGYLAVSLYMTGIEHAMSDATGDHSFPFISEAQRMLKLCGVWLFAVLFVWGFLGARRLIFPVRGGTAI
jgi:hypothetical protein